MSGTQLSVRVEEDLGLKNSVKICFINETAVGSCKILVCIYPKTRVLLDKGQEKSICELKRERGYEIEVVTIGKGKNQRRLPPLH